MVVKHFPKSWSSVHPEQVYLREDGSGGLFSQLFMRIKVWNEDTLATTQLKKEVYPWFWVSLFSLSPIFLEPYLLYWVLMSKTKCPDDTFSLSPIFPFSCFFPFEHSSNAYGNHHLHGCHSWSILDVDLTYLIYSIRVKVSLLVISKTTHGAFNLSFLVIDNNHTKIWIIFKILS